MKKMKMMMTMMMMMIKKKTKKKPMALPEVVVAEVNMDMVPVVYVLIEFSEFVMNIFCFRNLEAVNIQALVVNSPNANNSRTKGRKKKCQCFSFYRCYFFFQPFIYYCYILKEFQC
jgi:hypothetical protein